MASNKQDKADFQKLAEHYKNEFLTQLNNNEILQDELRKLRQENVKYEMIIDDMKCSKCKSQITNDTNQQLKETVNNDVDSKSVDESLKLELSVSDVDKDEEINSNLTDVDSNKTKANGNKDDLKVELDNEDSNVFELSQEQNVSINRAKLEVFLENGKYKINIKNKGKLTDKNRLMCACCNCTFNDKLALNHHFRNTHLSRDSKDNACFRCHICKSIFKRTEKLARHLNVTHKDHQFKCPRCSSLFSNRAGLSIHLKNMPCAYNQ